MLPRKNTIQERASTEDADEDSKGCPLFFTVYENVFQKCLDFVN